MALGLAIFRAGLPPSIGQSAWQKLVTEKLLNTRAAQKRCFISKLPKPISSLLGPNADQSARIFGNHQKVAVDGHRGGANLALHVDGFENLLCLAVGKNVHLAGLVANINFTVHPKSTDQVSAPMSWSQYFFPVLASRQ